MEHQSVVKSRYYWAILLFAVAGMVLLFMKCKSVKQFKSSGVVWTTEYHITYTAPSDMNDSIQAIFNAIDKSASVYNKQSLVTALNNNTTDVVDAYIAKLYNTSVDINKASDGAYDPTVMPLVNAWGFGYKSGKLPDKAQLDSILMFVGLNKTRLDGNKLIKEDKRVQFDFSSIAKGMACDEIAEMLKRSGATSAMVEIGGEVACFGVNDQGSGWNISIDMPIEQAEGEAVQHTSAAVVTIDNGGGVATSGSYRKWKESGGKKRSHIIDPKTGSADESNLLSVTIIAPNCMSADAWATACMAMGVKRTQLLMQNNTSLGVMTIHVDDGGNLVVWSNKAFADKVKLEN